MSERTSASERNAGLTADPLFVGLTRPPMRWGVAYMAIVFNVVTTMVVFILSKNLLTLLLALPVHGLCALVCARDARYFDLALLAARTRLPAYASTFRLWKASSCSALALELPNVKGLRRQSVCVRVMPRPPRAVQRIARGVP